MYLYSGYAPQVSSRLGLSATTTSLIGMVGNMGMAFSGPFAGALVDRRGLRLPYAIGATLIFFGFHLIESIFKSAAFEKVKMHQNDFRQQEFLLLALAQCMVGIGSTYVFSSLIKCAAVNFPDSRGAATSVPMAAFGLSAFVLSSVSSFISPGDTETLLNVLKLTPGILFLISFPFIRILRSSHLKHPAGHLSDGAIQLASLDSTVAPAPSPYQQERDHRPHCHSRTESSVSNHDQALDWTQLVRRWNFWHHFMILGLLGGIGQMYIYSCGYCVRALALASQLDLSVQTQVQSHQVRAISIASFTGRLCSGVVSDYVRSRLKKDRAYLLMVAAILCVCAQCLGLKVTEADNLWFLSATTGLFYGICYGSYPTIVGDIFGMENFSKNWGMLSLAPLPVSYCLNMIFGSVYDNHSTTDGETGQVTCKQGNLCYKGSFSVTMIASVALALGLVPAVLYRKR